MRTLMIVLLGAAAASCFAQDASRVTLTGDTLDSLRLEIRFDGIDFANPASVARAKAEIDMALEARLELQFGVILANEFARGYAGAVDPAILQQAVDREAVAKLRRESASLAQAKISVLCGKPESLAQNLILYPMIVTVRSGEKDLQKGRYRVTLEKEADGRWLVVRGEYLCPACAGEGKTEAKPCGSCQGSGWLTKPLAPLPEELAVDAVGAPEKAADAHAAAVAFLRRRVALSRRLLAGFANKVGPGYRDYCKRLFAPASLAAVKPAPPFSGDITYTAVESRDAGEAAEVEVRESVQPASGPASVSAVRVTIVQAKDGSLLVTGFGLPCPLCKGAGLCATCAGTGLLKGAPCADCEGSKKCRPCQGRGTVAQDLFEPRY